MRITYDENKRLEVLNARGLDFKDAAEVFDNFHLTKRDDRNYTEDRFQTVGEMNGEVCWSSGPCETKIVASSRCGSSIMKNAKDITAAATRADEQKPELDEDWFAEADAFIGTKLVRRGRPKAEKVKRAVSLRLDEDVIDWFKKGGPGWQTRMNDALRKAARV